MTENLVNNKPYNNIECKKIFAVVRTHCAQRALSISNALIAGGVKVIELAMGFDGIFDVISEITKNPEVTVAAGSVLTSYQANKSIEAGAKFIVSPVTELRLIKLCKGCKIPIITGAATPNEAYNAWKLGVNIIKIFPVKPLGGPSYIKDVLKPMPFLHLMPTGGVHLDNFTEYLDAGACAVGIGNAFYKDKTPEEITTNAIFASQKLIEYTNNKKQ